MSVVLVTGGTGVLGGHLIRLLRERDHEVRILSRRAGAAHTAAISTPARGWTRPPRAPS